MQTKKSQVLSLYKEIETMIQKNHIEADADFAKMKDKLTSMSKKVDEKIEGYDRRGCKTSHHRVKAIRNKFAANKEKCRGTHSKIKKSKGAYQRICLFQTVDKMVLGLLSWHHFLCSATIVRPK